ncbi:MAG: hypothetical protein AAF993_01950 [Pseudomonadota bacterium]
MKELLGRQFAVADTVYRVVDVRNVDGEAFVYAEVDAEHKPQQHSKGPGRAAFRYGDIEAQLRPAEMHSARA